MVDLALFGILILLAGASAPLSDPDLPQHLANGEWIVAHRAWPVIEPFAWTRAGEPYFAYSHLPQVLYYSLLSWFGPLGLRLFNGLVLAGAGAAVLVLGKFAGWRPWVSLPLAAYNVLIGSILVPVLRPQALLLVAVPLCWAFTYALFLQKRPFAPMLGLLLSSALAANSHLFFPITAAPLVLCAIRWPRSSWRVGAAVIAIVGGWLLSPYGFRWHDVFALNFGSNPLLTAPSPITEFRPGFTHVTAAILLLVPLMLLPWGAPANTSRRERLLLGAMWIVGLVAFGYAVRLVLVWWLISLPLAALVTSHAMRSLVIAPPRPSIRVAAYSVLLSLLVIVGNAAAAPRVEGDVRSRVLPSEAHGPTKPLVEWLECNVREGSTGRVFTWFNYGSYLTWRMPGYSMSIDGRTIFPDSVALAEALQPSHLPPRTLGPWASADLAIIPTTFLVADELERSPDWRLAVVHELESGARVGLWINTRWWALAGSTTLPSLPVLATERDLMQGCRKPVEGASVDQRS